jgi:starch synthase
MSKAALECLCFIGVVPAVIVTNDWFTGLCSAYSKNGHFGDTFKGSTFFHIAHNLESTYEGRIYLTNIEGTLDHIHKLPSYCLVDPYWKAKVINPSRCAIMMSDQWGTVSPSYKKDLLDCSPLSHLLKSHQKPFAFPNGIFKAQRLKALTDKAGTDRKIVKEIIQKKYFGFQFADNTVPLFSFVGRITQQKGVLLILDAAEAIIKVRRKN